MSGAMINDSGEYACNATNTFSTTIGGPAIVLVQGKRTSCSDRRDKYPKGCEPHVTVDCHKFICCCHYVGMCKLYSQINE